MGTAINLLELRRLRESWDSWKADWSTARANKLDNLDVTISSRASSRDVDNVREGGGHPKDYSHRRTN